MRGEVPEIQPYIVITSHLELGTLANNYSIIPESEAAATKTEEKLEKLNNELNNSKYVLSAPYIM